ncbi:MAG: hypothetical protein JXQ90_17995 [Cyclobacteriaceae bacterium]
MSDEIIEIDTAMPEKIRVLLISVLEDALHSLRKYSDEDPRNQDIDLMLNCGMVEEAIELLEGKGIRLKGTLTMLPHGQQIDPNQLEMF